MIVQFETRGKKVVIGKLIGCNQYGWLLEGIFKFNGVNYHWEDDQLVFLEYITWKWKRVLEEIDFENPIEYDAFDFLYDKDVFRYGMMPGKDLSLLERFTPV